MSAVLQSPLIEPGKIGLRRPPSNTCGRCIYFVDNSANGFTDRALLDYFGWTPYFGGKVKRASDGSAEVHVYL